MRLLYLMQASLETCQDHIVEHLRDAGHHVDVEIVVPEHPQFNIPAYTGKRRTLGLTEKVFTDQCSAAGYDAIISCLHNNEPAVRQFVETVKPRMGYIDVEHDLLGPPERVVRPRSLGVVAYHKKQHKWLLEQGYRSIMARWYKLDVDYDPADVEAIQWFQDTQPSADAVFIGSCHQNVAGMIRKRVPFEYGHLFRKVWYKRFLSTDTVLKEGTHELPPIFDTPRGSFYCAGIAGYHFTAGSSSYLDALLFGSIPILYGVKGLAEKQVSDVLSMVSYKPFFPCGYGLAVTTTNLDHKINLLRSSPQLFFATFERLRSEWFVPDLAELPSTGEAICRLIAE